MSDPKRRQAGPLGALTAALAGLAGAVAVSGAAVWDAVAVTLTNNQRDLVVWTSILAALGAVALALTTVLMGERRPRSLGVVATGAALGLLTIAYWFWVIEGILDTT